MGVTVGFSLQQFSEVLNIRDAIGQPYLLIGSHSSKQIQGCFHLME
jgi:hypothetical protein